MGGSMINDGLLVFNTDSERIEKVAKEKFPDFTPDSFANAAVQENKVVSLVTGGDKKPRLIEYAKIN